MQVTEGGAWHQGAAEATLANREALIESHRKRLEEARERAMGINTCYATRARDLSFSSLIPLGTSAPAMQDTCIVGGCMYSMRTRI